MEKTALVTGASSGIGRELAKLLAADGYRLVVVARRKDELETLARELTQTYGVFVKVIPVDLAETGAAEEVFRRVDAAHIEIEMLVNNAGFALFGQFRELDLEDQTAMVRVNVLAVVELTHLFLPGMLKRKRGKILNVASTSGFLPGPLMSVYYATKHFVLAFSESLQNELKGSGVTLTILAPGPTKTEFQKRAGLSRSKLIRGHFLPVEAVAGAGYEGMKRGKGLVIPGIMNQLTVQLPRFFPRSWLMGISRYIQDRKVKGE